ncbi:MAG: hypothetical protein M5U25_11490 [Planctomycetota bacterium]|nr:hypothetical protein [Planctomycetota bacterium]
MTGHWGCPACGSGKFSAWQGYTEWGSEKLYCHYTGDIEDDEDYETDDYGDRHSSDSESGDMEDTRECMECGYEYKQPEFYPDEPESDLEDYLDDDLIQQLEPILKTQAPRAAKYQVQRKPWATLINVMPREQTKGVHPRNKRKLKLCPQCGLDMSESTIRNVEANVLVQGEPVRLYDQGVQVVIVLPLCRQCHPQT